MQMDISSLNFLIMGLGVTGESAIKTLRGKTAGIFVYEDKTQFEIKEELKNKALEDIKIFDVDRDLLPEEIDVIVKSPGINPRHKLLIEASKFEIPVYSDIELAYRLFPDRIYIAVTGTNGKTTTSILAGQALTEGGHKVSVVGNVGVGILEAIVDSKPGDIFVVEASSFQLEHTTSFKPKAAAITNITPDHLDWHGSMDAYVSSKSRIFYNQGYEDVLVLNYEDPILRELSKKVKSRILWFSSRQNLKKGIFIEDRWIVCDWESKHEKVISLTEIQIPGIHNIENIMTVIGLSVSVGVSMIDIRSAVKRFKGVPHRIELVSTINGTKYYNDSKGTNPDSSIKAIEAVSEPIILIAGGYDKGSDFTELLASFKQKGKALILIGKTGEKIFAESRKVGIDKVFIVKDMDEAVKTAFRISTPGDTVLLSPACASWDMYNNYEERGDHFRTIVHKLME